MGFVRSLFSSAEQQGREEPVPRTHERPVPCTHEPPTASSTADGASADDGYGVQDAGSSVDASSGASSGGSSGASSKSRVQAAGCSSGASSKSCAKTTSGPEGGSLGPEQGVCIFAERQCLTLAVPPQSSAVVLRPIAPLQIRTMVSLAGRGSKQHIASAQILRACKARRHSGETHPRGRTIYLLPSRDIYCACVARPHECERLVVCEYIVDMIV